MKAPRPRRKAASSSSDVTDGYREVIETIFYTNLQSLLGSQELESAYAAFAPVGRRKTEEQLKLTAKVAAEYYVSHWKDGKPPSEEEARVLERKAFAYALKETPPD